MNRKVKSYQVLNSICLCPKWVRKKYVRLISPRRNDHDLWPRPYSHSNTICWHKRSFNKIAKSWSCVRSSAEQKKNSSFRHVYWFRLLHENNDMFVLNMYWRHLGTGTINAISIIYDTRAINTYIVSIHNKKNRLFHSIVISPLDKNRNFEFRYVNKRLQLFCNYKPCG